jgi:hypothetical protein
MDVENIYIIKLKPLISDRTDRIIIRRWRAFLFSLLALQRIFGGCRSIFKAPPLAKPINLSVILSQFSRLNLLKFSPFPPNKWLNSSRIGFELRKFRCNIISLTPAAPAATQPTTTIATALDPPPHTTPSPIQTTISGTSPPTKASTRLRRSGAGLSLLRGILTAFRVRSERVPTVAAPVGIEKRSRVSCRGMR